jgi:ABC-type uncharacterized transport system substrate-binding protein
LYHQHNFEWFEMVRRQVAVIVTSGLPAIFAAKAATSTIPVVFVLGEDPVRLGLADASRTESSLREVQTAARSMGLQVLTLNADTSREIDTAFDGIGRERPDALFVTTTTFFSVRLAQIALLAAFHRLPSSYDLREFPEAGGLMSYGTSIAEVYRQNGVYAGRILKGAKPADLPVVQSSKFELVINAHTARMLGIEVPPMLLARANEVIE